MLSDLAAEETLRGVGAACRRANRVSSPAVSRSLPCSPASMLAPQDQMGYASSPFGHRGFVAAATRQAEQKKARASAVTQTPKLAGKIKGVEGVRGTTRRRLSNADATRASDAPDSKRGKWTALLQLTRGTAADRIALVRSGIAADDVPSLIAALEPR